MATKEHCARSLRAAVGSCFRVPGEHYTKFEDHGPDEPGAHLFTVKCKDCFPAPDEEEEAEDDDDAALGQPAAKRAKDCTRGPAHHRLGPAHHRHR